VTAVVVHSDDIFFSRRFTRPPAFVCLFFLCTFLFYSVKKKREKQQKQKEDEVLNSYILPPRQNVEPGDELVS
jgi:hypothetical protein